MSWNVEIIDSKGNIMIVENPHKIRGVTIRADGRLNQIAIYEAELNITYNRSRLFYAVWGHGLDKFNNKPVSEVISKLKEGIEELGTDTDDDYWASTQGNAGASLQSLLFLCEQCPGGILKIYNM